MIAASQVISFVRAFGLDQDHMGEGPGWDLCPRAHGASRQPCWIVCLLWRTKLPTASFPFFSVKFISGVILSHWFFPPISLGFWNVQFVYHYLTGLLHLGLEIHNICIYKPTHFYLWIQLICLILFRIFSRRSEALWKNQIKLWWQTLMLWWPSVESWGKV